MAGFGDIFGGIGGLFSTGFGVAGALASSEQARQQARYFQQMENTINKKYQAQKAIQIRSNALEQGQFQQNTINAGIDTTPGASQSFDVAKQNLVQVQGEQLRQMDYENQLQILGIQQQIKNANQMASNYMTQAWGTGISGVLGSVGSIYSGYSGMQQYSQQLSNQKSAILNSIWQRNGGTGLY